MFTYLITSISEGSETNKNIFFPATTLNNPLYFFRRLSIDFRLTEKCYENIFEVFRITIVVYIQYFIRAGTKLYEKLN